MDPLHHHPSTVTYYGPSSARTPQHQAHLQNAHVNEEEQDRQRAEMAETSADGPAERLDAGATSTRSDTRADGSAPTLELGSCCPTCGQVVQTVLPTSTPDEAHASASQESDPSPSERDQDTWASGAPERERLTLRIPRRTREATAGSSRTTRSPSHASAVSSPLTGSWVNGYAESSGDAGTLGGNTAEGVAVGALGLTPPELGQASSGEDVGTPQPEAGPSFVTLGGPHAPRKRNTRKRKV